MAKIIEPTEKEKHELHQKRHFAFRLNVFFFITFALFSVLIVRLAVLQFVESPNLRMLRSQSDTISTPISPIRGNIYDSNGYPIAFTDSTQSLFYRIEPGQSDAKRIEMAKQLAEIFKQYGNQGQEELTADKIIEKMDVGINIYGEKTKQPSLLHVPRRIKQGLSTNEIAFIMEHRDELKGLEISEESIRKYDSNSIAVHMVGYLREFSTAINQTASYMQFYKDKRKDYLNDEYVGFDGLELMYQDVLRGTNGSKMYPVNAQQKIVGQVSITPPVKGNNLHLYMNKDVQLETEKAIMDHLQWMKSDEAKVLGRPYLGKEAVAAYAVAMEVKTGAVVTMASMPDYDPNVWNGGLSQSEWENIQNFYTNGTIRERQPEVPPNERGKHPTSLVPLGSTMKPLTVLVGLSEGLITPTDRYVDTGKFFYGKNDNAKVQNSGATAYGSINATDAIRVSSNTFMSAMIGNRLYMRKSKEDPLDIWDNYMKHFGLGVTTGSGLPGEQSGIIEYYKSTKTASKQSALVQASFGQQGKYTALQLAQYATTLANHGKRLKPQFVQKITTFDGQLVETFDNPEVLDEIVLPDKYWDVIEKGMLQVRVNGFEDFQYSFYRKTGTSQSDVAGKLLENAVFIAVAPADNPKLAVAVVVPEGGYGSWGAAPIARKIFDAYDKYVGLEDRQAEQP